jgi:hypothetical protein
MTNNNYICLNGPQARALGIEPVCERASAKHKGDSPTRSRQQAARGAPKK